MDQCQPHESKNFHGVGIGPLSKILAVNSYILTGQLKNCDLHFNTEFQFQINCAQRFQENFKSTNLCGLFIFITSKKKDRKSLFRLLVPYDSSSVLLYLKKYFYPIRLKIRKSSLIKKNHIFQF